VRNINHNIPVKCIAFNIKRKVCIDEFEFILCYYCIVKEIVSVDQKQIVRIYYSDGRAYKKFKVDIRFDQLIYCINEDEFVAWSRWAREIHVLNSEMEILSTSTCDYNIGDLVYNETTSDVSTCGRGYVTVGLSEEK
jgi:hypothetical protein